MVANIRTSLKSWKTSAPGIALILTALGQFFQQLSSGPVDWGIIIPMILTGIGLLFAKDGDKTSKDLGM